MACWTPNIDISENLFDVGSGLQTPGSMNAGEYASLQTALFDKQDDACVGKLTALNLRLSATALLEGPYNVGLGLMGMPCAAMATSPPRSPTMWFRSATPVLRPWLRPCSP